MAGVEGFPEEEVDLSRVSLEGLEEVFNVTVNNRVGREDFDTATGHVTHTLDRVIPLGKEVSWFDVVDSEAKRRHAQREGQSEI